MSLFNGSESELESLSEDIEKLSTNATTPNCDGFIYDVTLALSIFADSLKNVEEVIFESVATAVGDMMHKYSMWKEASPIIFEILKVKLLNCEKPKTNESPVKWNVTVYVSGYHFAGTCMDDLPIVYDALTYVGCMKPKPRKAKTPSSFISCPIGLNYTLKFFLSPAIEIAKPFYNSKGFHAYKNSNSTLLDLEKILHTDEEKADEDYNHQDVWNAARE